MKYAEEAERVSKSFKNIKGLKDFVSHTEKVTKVQEEFKASNTSFAKILKQQEALEQKISIARSSHGKQIELQRQELNKLNKANRESAKDTVNGVSAYQKLTRSLAKAREKAREFALTLGRDSKEYKEAQKRVEKLDNEVKSLDADLGQFQRNVGNYPGLGILESQLNGLGISMDQVSENGKISFATLTNGFKAVGKAALAFMVTPIGAVLTILGGLFALIRANKDTVIEFDAGLRDVGKTTNLAGKALRDLGDETVKLSRKLKVVDTSKLLEYQTIAGQLGVKGTDNILKFSESLAKLETASDISGEAGATDIARLLNLVDGGVQNIEQFGDEIVNLGNNFAATENEILSNATALAQNTGIYKIARQDLLAYATASKAVGLQQQVTGSSIGKTLSSLDLAINTGKNLKEFSKVIGLTDKELKKAFNEDKNAVLFLFLERLNQIQASGGSMASALDSVGLSGVETSKVIKALASEEGFAILNDAMNTVKDSSQAMTNEFNSASLKLENQAQRIGIAWDNLVLTLEDGQGIFSKVGGFIIGVFAEYLEQVTEIITELSNDLSELGKELGIVGGEGIDFSQVISLIAIKMTEGIRVFMYFVKGIKEVVIWFKEASHYGTALLNTLTYVFVKITTAINKFDISKPFKSISNFIDDLTSMNISKVVGEEMDKVEAEIQKERDLRIVDKLVEDSRNATDKLKQETSEKNKEDNGEDLSDLDFSKDDKKEKKDRSKEILENARSEIEARRKVLDFYEKSAKDIGLTLEAQSKLEKRLFEERAVLLAKEAKLDKVDLSSLNERAKKNEKLTEKEAEYLNKLYDLNKDYDDKISDLKQRAIDNEIGNFEINNQSVIENAKELTEELIKIEEDRIKKLQALREKSLENQYELNAKEVEAKINQGQLLTDEEIKFWNAIIDGRNEVNEQIQENQKNFDKQAFDELKEAYEKEYSLLQETNFLKFEERIADAERIAEKQKEEIENTILNEEVKAEALKSINENLKNRLNEIDQERFEYKSQIENAGIQLLNLGIDKLQEAIGRESVMSKAIAVLQATLNAFLSASQAKLNVLASPTSKALPDGGVSLAQAAYSKTLTSGLINVALIAGTQLLSFWKGTENAPYTGLAITDELGPELHFDKNWRLKDFGSDRGARFKHISKGDKILPADISKEILSTPRGLSEIKPQKQEPFNYDKLTKSISKAVKNDIQNTYLIQDGKLIKVTDKKGFINVREMKPSSNSKTPLS